MASSIDRLPTGIGHGIERSEMDRMGLVLDRMGSGVDRMGSGIDRMAPLGLDHLASSIDRMGPGMDRMGAGLGFGLDRMGTTLDRVGSAMDRMGSGVDRMGLGLDRMVPAGMGPVMDRMPAGLDRLGAAPMDRMGLDRLAAPMDRMGLDRMGAGATSMDRMGPALSQGMGAGLDRLGLPMGSTFERTMDMERGNFAAGNFTSALGTGGPVAAAGVARKACQIFVRNVSWASVYAGWGDPISIGWSLFPSGVPIYSIPSSRHVMWSKGLGDSSRPLTQVGGSQWNLRPI